MAAYGGNEGELREEQSSYTSGIMAVKQTPYLSEVTRGIAIAGRNSAYRHRQNVAPASAN